MTKSESLLKAEEIKEARFGPRDLKDPRSRAYAIQTLYSLKRWLESEEIEHRRIEEELRIIREYKHWKVLGYASEDELLETEVGLSRQQLVAKMAKQTKTLAKHGEIGKGRNRVDNVNSKTHGNCTG